MTTKKATIIEQLKGYETQLANLDAQIAEAHMTPAKAGELQSRANSIQAMNKAAGELERKIRVIKAGLLNDNCFFGRYTKKVQGGFEWGVRMDVEINETINNFYVVTETIKTGVAPTRAIALNRAKAWTTFYKARYEQHQAGNLQFLPVKTGATRVKRTYA